MPSDGEPPSAYVQYVTRTPSTPSPESSAKPENPPTGPTDRHDDSTITDPEADDASPVPPLNIQCLDNPDIVKPRNGSSFPVYRRVQQAIQAMADRRTIEQTEDLIDQISLIEPRSARAKSRAEQRQAMAVSGAVKEFSAEEFAQLGFPELQKNIERLLLMLAPMSSRMPVRIGNKIHASSWFKDYGDSTVKIVIDKDATPGSVIDAVILEMSRRNSQAESVPAETIISTIAKILGKGPPYTALVVKHPPGGPSSFEGDMSTISSNGTTFEEFSKRARDFERRMQPCKECWQMRECMQEDSSDVSKDECSKIGVQNYDTENEISSQRNAL